MTIIKDLAAIVLTLFLRNSIKHSYYHIVVYVNKKRVKRLFKIIKERLENLEIMECKKSGRTFDYLFKLKGVEVESEDFMDKLNKSTSISLADSFLLSSS